MLQIHKRSVKMRIVNLIENTEGVQGCASKHGLSFYIETAQHKILLDLGPSEETMENAQRLGIDLKDVDTVVLSHGHYDHSGGILSFAKINSHAPIYMQKGAEGEYYSDSGDAEGEKRYRYIGIDKEITNLPQVRFVEGDFKIDDGIFLFTVKRRSHSLPFTNRRLLVKKDGRFLPDDFSHEQCLVVSEDGRSILFSGCAHNGMLSILDAYTSKFGTQPDAAVSGFHLMKKAPYTDYELGEIIDMAHELKKFRTKFITCHCTGIPAYTVMKDIMGEQLSYVHSGEEVKPVFYAVDDKKNGRRSYMKWHKFFAWASVFCFVMTMVTGYKRR